MIVNKRLEELEEKYRNCRVILTGTGVTCHKKYMEDFLIFVAKILLLINKKKRI